MVHIYHKAEILDLLISKDLRLTVSLLKTLVVGKNWVSSTGSNKRNPWSLLLQGVSASSTSLA